MKKILLAFALFLFAQISYASQFTCWAYYKGEYLASSVTVTASSKEEASVKAMEKFKDLGKRVDSVRCEY